MIVEGKNATVPVFDITAVQEIVAESTKNVTIIMLKTLINAMARDVNMTSLQLAAPHINVNLKTELLAVDTKTKMVYKKLVAATSEHISHFSQLLGMLLSSMGQSTSKSFLKSFVFEETKQTVEILKTKQPESLELPEIWENTVNK